MEYKDELMDLQDEADYDEDEVDDLEEDFAHQRSREGFIV